MERQPKFLLVKPLPHKQFDPDALKVLRRLRKHGFQAYFVGGCVRDMLLGLPPKDFDIATSARPHQIRRLFRNCRIVGRRFLLANIHFGNKVIEVSTFRQNPWKDGVPADDPLLSDDNVFGSDEDDALRRDFTINALFYDPHTREVVDYVNGLEDLQDGHIRTIGDPWLRLREDPIRIIRALKFSARLGFQIRPDLLAALKGCRYDLIRSAPARLLLELFKILRDGSSLKCFQNMNQAGVLAVILPQVAKKLMHGEENPAARFFRAYLSGVDSIGYQQRRQLTEVVLLAILFHPLLIKALQHHRKPLQNKSAMSLLIEEVMDSAGQHFSLSRRNRERTKQVLLIQKRFEKPPQPDSAVQILRQECFNEALELFQLQCIGTNRNWELLHSWQHARQLHGFSSHIPRTRPKKRQRKRRRRSS